MTSVPSPTGDSPRLAFVGANVVDGTGRPPIPDAVVSVESGRIINVHRRGDGALPDGATVIDLAGKTIVPGLIDSHVHLGQLPHNRFGVDEPMALFETFMRMFVDRGVTTVRCTGSPDLAESFRMLKEGKPEWPRFYGSGPNLDGSPGGPHLGLRVVNTPDKARSNTLDLIQHGADFIKIYVWMTEAPLQAIVEVAHAHGLKVAAHVGNTLTAETVVRLGVDALEHIRVGAELLTDEERDEIARLPRRAHDHLLSFRPWRYIDVDSPRTEALLDLFVERGVHVTPTLVVARSALLNGEESVRRPPGIDLMPEAVIRQWDSKTWIEDFSDDDWRYAPIEWQRQLEFVGRAHRHGVKITAGTDMPNPYILPGYGLHEELAVLRDVGMSPLEVIRSATSRGAELLGIASELGTVEKGKLADLLIIGGDPIADIAALSEPWAVLKAGELVAGSGIDTLAS